MKRIELRLERIPATDELGSDRAPPQSGKRRRADSPHVAEMLESAERAMNEAFVNGVEFDVGAGGAFTRPEVIELQQRFAGETWRDRSDHGEIPVTRLHSEDGGWGRMVPLNSDGGVSKDSAPPLSGRVLVMDVLGFIALAMGDDDRLWIQEASSE